MPALRERIIDLPHLASTQLTFLSREMGRSAGGFSDAALMALRIHPWSGNLRELRNAIEHALIMMEGNEIKVDHLPAYLRMGKSNSPSVGAMVSLEDLERAHIERMLEATSSQEEAASTLGIDPTSLYRKRKRYNIQLPLPRAKAGTVTP